MNIDAIAGYKPVLYVVYGAYALAGLGFILDPSPAMNDLVFTLWYSVWVGLLIFGGVCGLFGAAMNKYYIEGVALIALIGSVSVYAAALLITSRMRDTTSTGVSLLIIASVAALFARALMVKRRIKISERLGGGGY